MEAPAPAPWPALGVLLIRDGLVSRAELEAALAEQGDGRDRRVSGQRLGEALVERGVVTTEQVARLVAEQHELPFVDLDESDSIGPVATKLPEELARRCSALPIRVFPDGSLLVAVADPGRLACLDDIRRVLGVRVRWAVAAPDAITASIEIAAQMTLLQAEASEAELEAMDEMRGTSRSSRARPSGRTGRARPAAGGRGQRTTARPGLTPPARRAGDRGRARRGACPAAALEHQAARRDPRRSRCAERSRCQPRARRTARAAVRRAVRIRHRPGCGSAASGRARRAVIRLFPSRISRMARCSSWSPTRPARSATTSCARASASPSSTRWPWLARSRPPSRRRSRPSHRRTPDRPHGRSRARTGRERADARKGRARGERNGGEPDAAVDVLARSGTPCARSNRDPLRASVVRSGDQRRESTGTLQRARDAAGRRSGHGRAGTPHGRRHRATRPGRTSATRCRSRSRRTR